MSRRGDTTARVFGGLSRASGWIATRWLDAARDPLASAPLRRPEILLAAELLALLALAVYMPHILDGGWYIDDWIHVAVMSEAGGLLDAIGAMSERTHRPGLAVSLSVFHAIGGEGQAAYLVIGALLAALQGWLFYLVARGLGLRTAVAAVAAGIFVVLPVIDSTRLWMAAFPIQVAGALYLGGVLAALHGLTQARGRRAAAWHAGAAALYLVAILTYELVAGLVLATGLLYIARCGWRPAVRRYPADLAAVALALALIAPRAASDRNAETSLGFLSDRATQILDNAESVFRWLLPWPDMLGGALGIFVLLVGLLGAGIAIGRGGRTGKGLADWAKIAAIAAVFSLAGLAMLLPADPYFVPRISGMGNRTGAFAAFGAVLLLMALIVLALAGLGMLVRRPRLGFALAAALVVATGVNLTAREIRQQDPWVESWRQQQEVVAAIDEALGGQPPGNAAVVSFGHTTFILPADVSVFAYSWDLQGALWETYGRSDIVAHPWLDGSCGPAGVVFPDETSSPAGRQPYGYDRLIFVDASTRTARRIPHRAACESAVQAFTS